MKTSADWTIAHAEDSSSSAHSLSCVVTCDLLRRAFSLNELAPNFNRRSTALVWVSLPLFPCPFATILSSSLRLKLLEIFHIDLWVDFPNVKVKL